MPQSGFTPAACLFDMDGLLLDTEHMFMSALVDLMQQHDAPAKKVQAFFVQLVGSSRPQTIDALAAFLPPHLDALEFMSDWRELHHRNLQDHVPVKPFVRAALAALKEQGVPMAVVTSTSGGPARHHLKVAGLLDYFECVVGGDEVTANKPDPAPYLNAAKKLNIAPESCAAFEDSDKGTAAAVAAGCVTFQIPDLRPPHQAFPELGQTIAPTLGAAFAHLGLHLGQA